MKNSIVVDGKKRACLMKQGNKFKELFDKEWQGECYNE